MDRAFQLHPNDGDDRVRESRHNCDEAIVMIQKTTGRIHDRFKEIADCVKGSAPQRNFSLAGWTLSWGMYFKRYVS